MASAPSSILGIDRSLTGRAWRWRGGNMDLSASPASLDHDLVTQLLLARGEAASAFQFQLHPNLNKQAFAEGTVALKAPERPFPVAQPLAVLPVTRYTLNPPMVDRPTVQPLDQHLLAMPCSKISELPLLRKPLAPTRSISSVLDSVIPK